jgi:hypothetical protein
MAISFKVSLMIGDEHTTQPEQIPEQDTSFGESDEATDSVVPSAGNILSNFTSDEFKYIRCSRCRKAFRKATKPGHLAMLNYGLNLWYCSWCAALVGWNSR